MLFFKKKSFFDIHKRQMPNSDSIIYAPVGSNTSLSSLDYIPYTSRPADNKTVNLVINEEKKNFLRSANPFKSASSIFSNSSSISSTISNKSSRGPKKSCLNKIKEPDFVLGGNRVERYKM